MQTQLGAFGWCGKKRGRGKEWMDGSDYVIGELTSIAKGHILIPFADSFVLREEEVMDVQCRGRS